MLDSVEAAFSQNGTIIFLIIMFLCSFGLPLAKSLVIVSAGILASRGDGNPVLLWLCCSAGLHLGDFGVTLIGRTLGAEALRRRPLNRFCPEKNIALASAFLAKHGVLALLGARVVPFVRGPCFFLLGSLRMNLIKFNLINSLTALVYCLIFFLIGYHVGNNSETLIKWTHSGNTLMVLLLVLFFLGYGSLKLKQWFWLKYFPELQIPKVEP